MTTEHEGTEPTATPRRRLREWLLDPGTVAVIAGMVLIPIAFLLPRIPQYQGGSGSIRSFAFPLAAGFLGGVVLFLAGLKRPSGWLAGTSAAMMAGWVVMILSTALRGTPFPFYGLIGDAGRLTAMATRYSTTAASSDAIMVGLPSEYPPLFPWVVGRTAALIDIPAWRLVGDFEVLFTGLAIIAGFVLWQRLLSPWLALAVTVAGFMMFPLPVKAYELVTLLMFVPWVLGTFMNPPKGRLHWLASGLAGGIIVMTYFGWIVFGGIGLLALAFLTWRSEKDRRGYLLYLLKAGAVAFVVASWFIVPLLYAKFTIGGSTVADMYGSSNMMDAMFPFMQFTYPGVHGILAALQLVGVIGMIWLRGKTWWATPLLILVVGAYVYRVLGAVLFILTDHTALSQYTPSIYMSVMAIAGVLTLAHATPRLASRLSLATPKAGAAIVLVLALGWSGYSFATDWTPGLGGRYSDYTERAYREPYPNGVYAKGIENPTPWFPVTPIQNAVEGVLGPDHDGVALSVDERLFAYLPWHGYVGNDLWSSISRVHERVAEVERLAAIRDPQVFTRESQHLKFSRIDIFVLAKKDAGWQWSFHRGFNQPPAVVNFDQAQFDLASWVIIDNLPENTVVVVRKP